MIFFRNDKISFEVRNFINDFLLIFEKLYDTSVEVVIVLGLFLTYQIKFYCFWNKIYFLLFVMMRLKEYE